MASYKVIDNVSKVQKATGGGSVQYKVQNNKVVITGATVKSDNSKVAQVKVTTGKPVQADSNKEVILVKEVNKKEILRTIRNLYKQKYFEEIKPTSDINVDELIEI